MTRLAQQILKCGDVNVCVTGKNNNNTPQGLGRCHIKPLGSPSPNRLREGSLFIPYLADEDIEVQRG